MHSYQIEKLTKNNLSFIDELYAKVYRKKRPASYYENKYNTDYVGVEAFGYFALHEGHPIGFLGIIPINLSMAGKTSIGAQLVDAMVDSKHRSKGVFEGLLRKILVDPNIHLIQLIFGFPNQNSFHLLVNKLNFKHLHTMNNYVIKSDTNHFKKIINIIWHVKFKKQKGNIENNLLKLGYDGVIYDANYLNYKTYNQNFIFENDQYAVWISDSKKTWLGAINIPNKENLRAILNLVSKKYSSKSFTYLISPHNELDTLFSKIVLAQAGFAVCVYDLTGKLNLNKLKFQFADIDIF